MDLLNPLRRARDLQGAEPAWLAGWFATPGRRIRDGVAGLELIWEGKGDAPANMTDYRAAVVESAVIAMPEPAPDQPVGIFYPSGTTGGPKGATLTRRSL